MTEQNKKTDPNRKDETPSAAFDVSKILACPECRCGLTDSLKCPRCGKQYTYERGVYDLISLALSEEQEYLCRENEEEREEIFTNFLDMDWQQGMDDYYKSWNEESLAAQRRQDEKMEELIRGFSGVVCDLATGGGTNLEKMLRAESDFSIICTDINKLELMVTRANKEKRYDKKNICYIATDGRYLSLQDECVDIVTAYSGFTNVPEGEKVAKELYRILKPGGRLVMQDTFFEKGSKSHEVAAGIGLGRGSIEEFLLSDLAQAGFKNVVSTSFGEAVWAGYPDDLLPVAGDKQKFCIITAEK